MIAGRSRCCLASASQQAPRCISPALQHDAAADRPLLHQRMAFGRLWKRQHAADERLHRLGGEQVQRHAHVLEGRVAGPGDANAPHDYEAGVELDRPRADIAEHHHRRQLRAGAQAFAERPGHHVLQHDVDALLAGAPPHLTGEFQIRTDYHLVGTSLPYYPGLVGRTRHRHHARLHTLCPLDLMQAKPAAGAGDQHALPRLGLGNAERRAHAGADWADRERRCRDVDAVGYDNRVARRHAGKLGIAAPALLAEHTAVAAESLPPVEAIAAGAAEQPLIEHNALADAFGRNVGAGGDDLAGNLMPENAARLAWNLAAT